MHERSSLLDVFRGRQDLACGVLFGDLLRRNEALDPEANVLVEPWLAIVSLEPSLAPLLLQRVEAGPCREATEEGLAQARRLIDIWLNPTLVPIPCQPPLVLLLLLGIVHALPGDLPFQTAQCRVVASPAETLAELDLDWPELIHQAINLDALL